MQTKAKTNSVVTHAVEGRVITFNVKDAGSFTLDLDACSQAVRDRAMLHGMIQRISDRAAISRDSETGRAATPQEKLDAMKGLADFYATGTEDWAQRAASPKKRELTLEEKKALIAKWTAEMGGESPL